MNSKRIFFIVGPTAVGKTDIAVCLAQKIQGEIISCDAMQVYREMDIASNKPAVEVLKRIPHHLINVVSVQEEFDVARFNQLALEAIGDIHARHRVPVIVGGSGLYMQILLDGIFSGGAKNEDLRQAFRHQAQVAGPQALYAQLVAKDSRAAAKIHPNDLKRIIRALEINMTRDKPISELQKNREGLWGKYHITLFALNRDREDLYRRIEQRVDSMFERGLVDEIKKFNGIAWSQTAEGIIGVREINGYLKGEYPLDRARELIKQNTRRLAKRQLTWFRKEQRLRWLMLQPQDQPETIVERMLQEPHTSVWGIRERDTTGGSL